RGKLIAAIPTNIQKCDSCQSTYNGTLPLKNCLYYSCKGTLPLRAIDASEYYRDSRNFHLHFYRLSARRMIAEEDSGSLRSSERQKIENKFKSGQIDLIVSTPTLELGVDIGDLVSVGLAKSPPSPASYAQRTGRAGREKKIALTTAFQFQSPLDMYYFRNPKEIMSGVITPPLISLENRTIVDRHINSLLIEEVFVHSPFADSLPGNLKEFVDNSQQFENVIQYLSSIRSNIKQKIERTFNDIQWLDSTEIDKRIDLFPKLFSGSLERFKRESKILNDIFEEIDEARRALRGQVGKQIEEDRWRLSRMEANIEYRLSGFPDGLNSRDLLSHLSRTEIIPRYAFPGKAVQVVSDLQEEFGDRSAQIAVSELAPGMPLYMKKNIFEVLGFDFEQEPEGSKTSQFWVCKNCKLYATEIEPKSRKCPQCQGTKGFDRLENCIAPKLVIVDQKGRPSEEGREFIQANTDHFVLSPISLDESTSSNEFIKSFAGIKAMDLGVKEILTLTTSLNTPNGEQPFAICRKCGRLLKNFQEDKGHRSGRRRICNGKPFVANLFHTFGTNVIALKIPSAAIPNQDIDRFLITLKNALISASDLVVQAEEGEIDGVIKPDTQTIVLFDNIDGGVGYVKQIISRLDEVLVKAASRILLECDCESGCIKCLWAYRRKRDIANIDKRLVFDFFKQVEREYSEKRVEENGSLKPYVGNKIISVTSLPDTLDGALELRDRLLGAQGEIELVSLYVTDYPISWPDGELSWVDVLCQCKRSGSKVTVVVREPNRVSHRRALNKLAKAGVTVMVYGVPVTDVEQTGIAHLKHAVIDYGKETACAIHMTANLSPEVRKNVDTYDFGSGKENLEWIEGTFTAIKQVKSQAKLWSISD
ncbi:MAG: DUF1998 domain-containing protein, partial [Oligoflexia bacterium]|nr:DUF1998 domain-containing protein [Oligoflexia bacterium]